MIVSELATVEQPTSQLSRLPTVVTFACNPSTYVRFEPDVSAHGDVNLHALDLVLRMLFGREYTQYC